MKTTPDKWVVVKITSDLGIVYKVMGSWYGGYLYGNSWRMNSGIVKVEKTENSVLFYGSSGSCYECFSTNYGMHMESSGIIQQLNDMAGVTATVLDSDTDWQTIDYNTELVDD